MYIVNSKRSLYHQAEMHAGNGSFRCYPRTVPPFRCSRNTREPGRAKIYASRIQNLRRKGGVNPRRAKNGGFTLLAVGLLCHQYLMFVAFPGLPRRKRLKWMYDEGILTSSAVSARSLNLERVQIKFSPSSSTYLRNLAVQP